MIYIYIYTYVYVCVCDNTVYSNKFSSMMLFFNLPPLSLSFSFYFSLFLSLPFFLAYKMLQVDFCFEYLIV